MDMQQRIKEMLERQAKAGSEIFENKDTSPIRFGTWDAYKIKVEGARLVATRARAVKKTGALRYTLSTEALEDKVLVKGSIEYRKVSRE